MKCIAWIIFGGLSLFSTTQAASFDCNKAATDIEKLICGDTELSKLDDELNAAYKIALQDGTQTDSTKQAQKQWIKVRNNCSNTTCIKHAYEDRLKAMTVSDQTQHDPFPFATDQLVYPEWAHKGDSADNIAYCERLLQDLKNNTNIQFLRPTYQAKTVEELEQGNQFAACKASDFIKSVEIEGKIWDSVQNLPKEERDKHGTAWTMSQDFRLYPVKHDDGGHDLILYGGGSTSSSGKKADFSDFVVTNLKTCEPQSRAQVYDVVHHPDATVGIVQHERNTLIYDTKYYQREQEQSLRFQHLKKRKHGKDYFETVCTFTAKDMNPTVKKNDSPAQPSSP